LGPTSATVGLVLGSRWVRASTVGAVKFLRICLRKTRICANHCSADQPGSAPRASPRGDAGEDEGNAIRGICATV